VQPPEAALSFPQTNRLSARVEVADNRKEEPMPKRTLLIVAPICVVVLAAGVAFAAPSGGEHASDARLDHLHAVRPTAASPAAYHPVAFEFLPRAMQRVAEYVQAVQLQEIAAYVQSVQLQEIVAFVESVIAEENARAQAEAEAAARAAAQAAAARQVVRSAPSSSPSTSSSTNSGALECIKQRESGGNYGVYNSQGSGASGAYQFMPSTWNSTASSVGRTDLVGVDPAAASPSDQDAMAAALYGQQGSAPWGGSCG
jgi:Transglycosylase-like domain